MVRLITVGFFALCAAGLVAGAILLPPGARAAWPVVVLIVASHALSLATMLVYRLYERLIDRPKWPSLSSTAAEWVRDRLRAIGVGWIQVLTCDDLPSAYHPASETILLSERTYAERTLRARAVAAHELGHALFHNRWPRLSRLLLAMRGWSAGTYTLGLSMLVASVLVAPPGFREISFALLAAGAAMSSGVLVDEASASLRARRVLAGDPELTPAARQAANTGLVLAFATYAINLVVKVLPLLVWSELVARLGDGVIEPTAPLAGWLVWVANAGLMAVAGGVVGGVLMAGRPDRLGGKVLGVVLIVLTLALGPAFALAVAGQPAVLARPWVIAVAAIGVWETYKVPLLMPFMMLLRRLARGVDMVAPTPQFSFQARRESVPIGRLARSEPGPGWWSRLAALRAVFRFLPIALVYLGLL